jgi:hypothetical protein
MLPRASKEQSQGIEQVNSAVTQMDKVTQANADESASASEELNAQAATLRETVAELLELVGGNDGRPNVRKLARGPVTRIVTVFLQAVERKQNNWRGSDSKRMIWIVNPLEFIVLCPAGWINRHQQNVIAYLLDEVNVLKEQPGRKPRFNDDQRRRLAAKAKKIGLKHLAQIASCPKTRTFD